MGLAILIGVSQGACGSGFRLACGQPSWFLQGLEACRAAEEARTSAAQRQRQQQQQRQQQEPAERGGDAGAGPSEEEQLPAGASLILDAGALRALRLRLEARPSQPLGFALDLPPQADPGAAAPPPLPDPRRSRGRGKEAAPPSADLLGVALSWRPDSAAYVPLDGAGGSDAAALAAELAALLGSAAVEKVTHGLKRQLVALGEASAEAARESSCGAEVGSRALTLCAAGAAAASGGCFEEHSTSPAWLPWLITTSLFPRLLQAAWRFPTLRRTSGSRPGCATPTCRASPTAAPTSTTPTAPPGPRR